MEKIDLRDDWRALGVRVGGPRKPMTPLPRGDFKKVAQWVRSLGTGHGTMMVPGTREEREAVYRTLEGSDTYVEKSDPRSWLHGSPRADWAIRVGRVPVSPDHLGMTDEGPYGWLLALAWVPDLFIEEPLRSMSDMAYSYTCEAMRGFLHVRFAILEGKRGTEVESLFGTFLRWVTGGNLTDLDVGVLGTMGIRRPNAYEIDVLMFFLALAHQNGVIRDTVFVFDDLEAVANRESRERVLEFMGVLEALDRWVRRTGVPVGFLLGFDPRYFTKLRRTYLKFGSYVGRALDRSIEKEPHGVSDPHGEQHDEVP